MSSDEVMYISSDEGKHMRSEEGEYSSPDEGAYTSSDEDMSSSSDEGAHTTPAKGIDMCFIEIFSSLWAFDMYCSIKSSSFRFIMLKVSIHV